MWKTIGKACGWKHPKAPSVKHLWKDKYKATEAVLDFLRDTGVGYMLNLRRLSGEEGGEGGEGEINEEDGPGPPWAVFSFSPSSVSFLCHLSFFPLSRRLGSRR